MAATLTEVSQPKGISVQPVWGDVRTHVFDVAFDSSYPTGGYVLTAAQVGLSIILGALVIGFPDVSGGATMQPIRTTANAAGSTIAIQSYTSNGNAPASLAEVPNTTDLHTLTARILFLGY